MVERATQGATASQLSFPLIEFTLSPQERPFSTPLFELAALPPEQPLSAHQGEIAFQGLNSLLRQQLLRSNPSLATSLLWINPNETTDGDFPLPNGQGVNICHLRDIEGKSHFSLQVRSRDQQTEQSISIGHQPTGEVLLCVSGNPREIEKGSKSQIFAGDVQLITNTILSIA